MDDKQRRCPECKNIVPDEAYECADCARQANILWWLNVGSLIFISAAFGYLIFLF